MSKEVLGMKRLYKRIKRFLIRHLFYSYDPDYVIEATERTLGHTITEIRGPSRYKSIAHARIHLIRNLELYTDLSVSDIAKCINRSPQYVYSILKN